MKPLNFHRTGAGEPLLLIHGLGSESCVWEPVLGTLAARHDVIVIDLPGFGRSKALPRGRTPTPAALADAVAELMDDLEIRDAHVAGNSLGGWVALELAKLGRARTVVGLCPAGLWGRPRVTAGRPVAGRGHRIARRLRPLIGPALLVPRLRRLVLSPFVARPERVPYRAAWRMVSSYARATAYEATSSAMRQDHLREAERIRVPVTLAFGQLDRLIAPTRSAIAGARVVVLPGCGHIPMWDDPELVATVLLDGAAAGAALAAAS